MRMAAGLIFAGAVSLLTSGAAWSQTSPPKGTAAAAPQAAPAAAPAPARPACNNPNALGIGRTVEIDTTGGPGFGFEHFKELDFLRERPGEIILLHALGIDQFVLAELQYLAVIEANRERADKQERAQNKPKDAHTPRAHTFPPSFGIMRHPDYSFYENGQR